MVSLPFNLKENIKLQDLGSLQRNLNNGSQSKNTDSIISKDYPRPNQMKEKHQQLLQRLERQQSYFTMNQKLSNTNFQPIYGLKSQPVYMRDEGITLLIQEEKDFKALESRIAQLQKLQCWLVSKSKGLQDRYEGLKRTIQNMDINMENQLINLESQFVQYHEQMLKVLQNQDQLQKQTKIESVLQQSKKT
eukprot:TRINITY_DN5504_c0_g1_i1.p2 TRINITY_DN5504_c0_g1~~TRINITY_DN5504_c0_g1_i1.p2  ORF type:complete len:191 (-),score=17.68 TRINITY_DN5504_c0_g1_i1:373-945(-)